MIESISPTTGDVLATFDELSPQQVEDAIASAHVAWKSWSRTPLSERERAMHGAAKCWASTQPSGASPTPDCITGNLLPTPRPVLSTNSLES
jgi:hypothetical protein